MGQILLVRHGQASFGSDDYDCLSDLGVEQSRLLGAFLASTGRKIDHVVTGGMKRHRQTADACLAVLPDTLRPAVEWRAEPGFDEYDADEVVIRHRPEFADRAVLKRHLAESDHPRRAFQAFFSEAVDRWVAGQHDHDYREPWSAFRNRCVTAVQRLAQESGPSRVIAVFTSGGPITAICQHLLALPDSCAFRLNWAIVNSAVTSLLYRSDQISLSSFNVFAHLEQTGKPQLITYR